MDARVRRDHHSCGLRCRGYRARSGRRDRAAEALRWHYQHSSTETRTAAQEVWRALPDSADHRLALVLHDSWGTLLGDDDGSGYQQEEQDRLFSAVVAEITTAWPGTELVDRLEQRLADEHLAFGNAAAHSSFFVWTLTQEKPSIADELCRRVLQTITASCAT